MSHEVVLSAVLAIAMLVCLLLFLMPGPCRCEKCAFHTNERRMARERQKDLQHDTAHKGFGSRSTDPDLFACQDAECPRNPRPKA